MPEPANLDFELLPNLGDSLTNDERLDAAVARMDGVNLDLDLGEAEYKGVTPYGRSWAFDFANGVFFRYGASPAETTGIETLKTWCEKALQTFAGEHIIYPDWFGVERVEVIGQQYDGGVLKTLVEAVREALLAHDRIRRVDNISIQRPSLDDDYVVIGLTIVTDTDQLALETEVAVG